MGTIHFLIITRMASKSNLTSTEENKSRIINLSLEKKITNGEAAKQLGITTRQVRRLKSSSRQQRTPNSIPACMYRS